MAALGLPLVHDHFYPVVNDPPEGDYSEPLQLLARRIAFVDPLSGEERVFESRRVLALADRQLASVVPQEPAPTYGAGHRPTARIYRAAG